MLRKTKTILKYFYCFPRLLSSTVFLNSLLPQLQSSARPLDFGYFPPDESLSYLFSTRAETCSSDHLVEILAPFSLLLCIPASELPSVDLAEGRLVLR